MTAPPVVRKNIGIFGIPASLEKGAKKIPLFEVIKVYHKGRYFVNFFFKF
jgi:hypothetical protein